MTPFDNPPPFPPPLGPDAIFPDLRVADRARARAIAQRQTRFREGVDAGSPFAAAAWVALMAQLVAGPVTPAEGPILLEWEQVPLPLVVGCEEPLQYNAYATLLRRVTQPWQRSEPVACAQRRVRAMVQKAALHVELVFLVNGVAATLPTDYLLAYTLPPLFAAVNLARTNETDLIVRRRLLPEGQPMYGLLRVRLLESLTEIS